MTYFLIILTHSDVAVEIIIIQNIWEALESIYICKFEEKNENDFKWHLFNNFSQMNKTVL